MDRRTWLDERRAATATSCYGLIAGWLNLPPGTPDGDRSDP
jgi:hypothetical protein